MTTAALAPPDDLHDAVLASDVLAHLDVQLASARRLLAIVLEQGKGIRARDVQTVVAATGALQIELHRRRAIEEDRARLLERSGARLRRSAAAVTLEALTTLMPADLGRAARDRSAELRGLLAEVQREHSLNRALMTQELAFLDQLLRLVDGEGPGAYDGAAGSTRPSALATRRVLDMRA